MRKLRLRRSSVLPIVKQLVQRITKQWQHYPGFPCSIKHVLEALNGDYPRFHYLHLLHIHFQWNYERSSKDGEGHSQHSAGRWGHNCRHWPGGDFTLVRPWILPPNTADGLGTASSSQRAINSWSLIDQALYHWASLGPGWRALRGVLRGRAWLLKRVISVWFLVM